MFVAKVQIKDLNYWCINGQNSSAKHKKEKERERLKMRVQCDSGWKKLSVNSTVGLLPVALLASLSFINILYL